MTDQPNSTRGVSSSEVTILLIEDDDVDAMAVDRVFRKLAGALTVHLHRAHDGEEGLEMLRSLYTQGVGPLMVLLDINMPRLNGHDFLRLMRRDPVLGSTTVFVLSTSSDPEDIRLAYDQYVAGYLTKSATSGPDLAVGKLITDYAENVVFPTSRSGH